MLGHSRTARSALRVGLLLGITVAVASCKTGRDQPSAVNACQFTDKAAADFQLFLQNYPGNQSGALLQITDMKTQLGNALSAGPKSEPDLMSAIQDAYLEASKLAEEVKDGVPVNTGPLSDAMQSVGNWCSEILGDEVGVP